MAIQYFIEQAPDRLYDHGELNDAQNRALRLRKQHDGRVFLVAQEWNPDTLDYDIIGRKGFFYGHQSFEGRFDAFLAA